jgi:hypothetical protein
MDQNKGERQQQVEIRVDESKMVTTYANTIRTSTTADELVLDFGLNLTGQSGPNEPVRMIFSVGSRVVMNWAGAKRLMASLQQAVGGYEQTYGAIDLNAKLPSGGRPAR